MRVENGSIRMEDDEEVSFGDSDDARIYWDSELGELVGVTISGVALHDNTYHNETYATTDLLTTVSGDIVAQIGEGGVSTFLGLTDAPASYDGQAGKYVAVNSGADGLEFVDAPEGGSATLSGAVDATLDFFTNRADIWLGYPSSPNDGNGDYPSIFMDVNAGLVTVAGRGHGIIAPRAFVYETDTCPSGCLVSMNANRRVVPTDFVNNPTFPAIGFAIGANETNPTNYCDVVVFGGVYSPVSLGTGGRGKAVYVDPTSSSGVVTTTEPTTAGQYKQVVGFQTGSTAGFFCNPDATVVRVGEALPSTWRFEANGDDLELKFYDGDSWNLITTFSGITE